MPTSQNSKLIQKYVPEKHIMGSNIEVDLSGYLLLRDNYLSIFPSIMEFREITPFGEEDSVLMFRWCAYVVINGDVYLTISRNESLESLQSELSRANIEIWAQIPKWYLQKITENEGKIRLNCWRMYMEKNVILYLKSQSEYGYMQGEDRIDKMWLYPNKGKMDKDLMNNIRTILYDKLILGQIDKTKMQQILTHYKTILHDTTDKK